MSCLQAFRSDIMKTMFEKQQQKRRRKKDVKVDRVVMASVHSEKLSKDSRMPKRSITI
jgi:hypothetical protein